MQIQINTDHNIRGSHEFLTETAKFEEIVQGALGHFKKYITRIEVHFTDENAGKTGFGDKRCLIEARVSGVQAIVATHHANNLIEALDGATEKLRNSLNHLFGKMKKH
jgi:ribosome-associated translation inhibitor RaiA